MVKMRLWDGNNEYGGMLLMRIGDGKNEYLLWYQ
jgi:hypothetical protein